MTDVAKALIKRVWDAYPHCLLLNELAKTVGDEWEANPASVKLVALELIGRGVFQTSDLVRISLTEAERHHQEILDAHRGK